MPRSKAIWSNALSTVLFIKTKRYAFEAFVLTWLLVKTDETGPIYKALADHKEEKVKLALLHVLQTVENEHTFQSLSELLIQPR